MAENLKRNLSNSIHKYYVKLLNITQEDIFTFGEWELLEPITAGNGNLSFENFLAWQWSYKNIKVLVIINYSELASQCRIKIDTVRNKDFIVLQDQLNGKFFDRSVSEIKNTGLFIELKGFGSHIFAFSEL